VDVSLLDSVAALLTYQAGRHFAGDEPVRTGNRHATIAPYDTFDAADGLLVLAVGNDAQWRSMCAALDMPDLSNDARYATNAGRVEHYASLRIALGAIIKHWFLDPLVLKLRQAGVPCGAVRSISEALADPQIIARQMVETVAHPSIGALNVLGMPTKLSDTPGRVSTPPPQLGEHTRRVLENDLGMSGADVDRLVAANVVK